MPTRSVLFIDHETRLSGGELDLVDLVRGLVEVQGADPLDLHLALPAEGPLSIAARELGVTVHHLPMASSLRGVSRWQLARNPLVAIRMIGEIVTTTRSLSRLVATIRPSVLHTNSMKSHLLAVPVSVRRRVPHIWHVRDILLPGWLRTAFNGVAGASAARVVCISSAVAQSFSGRAATKVRVVHNGVRPVDPSADDVRTARARVGARGEDDFLVGIVGQIARWKGQDVLLEAAALLRDSYPMLRVAVVGACLFPGNEDTYERGLHELVELRDLTDRVIFTGAIEPIEPVMGALDLLVHASRLPEPFGRVIIESMAQGTPVISTTIGAGRELIPEGAGVLVPPADPEALAEAVAMLIDDAEGAASRSATAREASTRFDVTATALGVLDVYREVLGDPT